MGHLALALTSPQFRETWAALHELHLRPQRLRPAALRSLGGFFAKAEAQAEAWLVGLCSVPRPSRLKRMAFSAF